MAHETLLIQNFTRTTRKKRHLRSPQPLQRTLSSLETNGFGLSGLLLWLGTAPSMHAALGIQAIWVWLPGAIAGILLNLQVQRLGIKWPKMSGGTPNYTTRLLKKYPGIARYGAIGYFLGWVSVPSMNAIVLTELIQQNLQPLGIACPETLLKIGFTAIPFILAFSGTRALSILHLFFVLPAIGFLLIFCIQGLGWLAFSPASLGFFPSVLLQNAAPLTFTDWAKWFFIAVYAVYGCETASSFVADSRSPHKTLRFLTVAAILLPIVYLGGSWVIGRLATESSGNTFLTLVAAAKPFWGQSASVLVTFLIACGCLLSSSTAVSNSPRILYQLARDQYVSPIFAIVSRRGVLTPGIIFTLCLSLACLVWGDVPHVVMVTGTGYLSSMMAIHLGLWLCRDRPETRWPRWALGFLLVEIVVLWVGGWAWGSHYLIIGLLLPIAMLMIDRAIAQLKFAPFQPAWWYERERRQYPSSRRSLKSTNTPDWVTVQVVVLILLVCGAVAIGWVVRGRLDGSNIDANISLFVILLISVAFIGVAIACWTSLPQVVCIAEAREAAEHLFNVALDAIIVLDEQGKIRQANPSAESLFGVSASNLMGLNLSQLLPGLTQQPEQWLGRSELVVYQQEQYWRTIELSASQRVTQELQEYMVILRDISDRKQAEEALRKSEAREREKAQQLEIALQNLQQTQATLIQTEKMSSLGQLVAGVAHEINNPVNFIHGNLTYVSEYTQVLLDMVALYQQHYPNAAVVTQQVIEAEELDFMVEDLPKILSSMKVGTDRIRQIVLTLRNFSRVDEAEMKPVNIHDGIDSTLVILHNRLKARAERPAIQGIKEYGDLPTVECYAGQLNQVFMNLLSNAIDALNQQDKEHHLEAITNSPHKITIRTQLVNPDWVRISIHDNGPGMSETVKTRLFDPFFTTKPVGEGTGLGLCISYQIVVDKHGGQIKCLSEIGQGAEFLIEIPVKQTQ